MLTVKHVHGGVEQIYPAPFGVIYHGPFAEVSADRQPTLLVLSDPETGGGRLLHSGLAYVMNDTGSTVGTYRLDGYPVAEPA